MFIHFFSRGKREIDQSVRVCELCDPVEFGVYLDEFGLYLSGPFLVLSY